MSDIKVEDWKLDDIIMDSCGNPVVAILTIDNKTPMFLCNECIKQLRKEISNFEYRSRYK